MADTPRPTRQDTWLISVQVENPGNPGHMIDYGTFDKMTGGAKQSQATQYRPGGMGDPISLGGKPTVTNVVVSRLARVYRDLQNIRQLLDAVGQSKMVVSRVPLDFEGNTYAGIPQMVYTGKLDRVSVPDIDSEGNAATLIELEMVVEGYPTA
jgi:hypothetical protein